MSKEAFQEALATAPFIALASSVDDQPNVRLIDTYYDADKNMLLFPTSRKTPKVAEFAKNEKSCFYYPSKSFRSNYSCTEGPRKRNRYLT